MKDECYICHIRTINRLIEKYKPDPAVSDLFREASSRLLIEKKDKANPYLATDIHRLARNIIKETDLYAEEKAQANHLLLNSYSRWKALVENSSNPFYAAAKLAVTGNIIDYGAKNSLNVDEELDRILTDEEWLIHREGAQFFQDGAFITALKHSKSLLYLADNAGEIVFDRVLLEVIGQQFPQIKIENLLR